jgi:predicted transcriptional regulator
MTLAEQIDRLLALPREIARVGRQLTALRAEKRTLEDDLKRRAATVRVSARKRVEFEGLKTADAREDYLTLAVLEDTDYEEGAKRLRELQAAIDKAQTQKDELQDEHQSLRAVLEGRYADLLERALTDRQLAELVMRHGRNLA